MTDQAEIEAGAILAGRYRVEQLIGRGGMGVVVKAMHLQLHQPVAMKLLRPEVLENQQVVMRFLREAQASVHLKSEHVARVIDVGVLETGAPYIVLEYLEGNDLSKLPRSELTVGAIIDLVLQACEALAEAHALGIVHRDIKPANLFITRGADGTPLLKVLDFGISKTQKTSGELTGSQTVMGTPPYMSPEQMRSSRDVDHRTDIWSLGVVLYELLQGTRPFEGDTFSLMVLKVVNDPVPRLTVRLPGDLADIVYRCLEKDPAKRFPNIAELALAISRYAQSDTQAALSVRRTKGLVGPALPLATREPSPGKLSVLSTISNLVSGEAMPRPAGRRWPVLAAIAALVGVIVVVLVASSGRSASPPAAEPAPDRPQVTTFQPLPVAPLLDASVAIATPPDAAAVTPPAAGAVDKRPRKLPKAAAPAKTGPPPTTPPTGDDDVLSTRK